MVELACKCVVIDGGDDTNVAGVRGADEGAGVIDDGEVDHREGGAHEWIGATTAAADVQKPAPIDCHSLEDGEGHIHLRVELAGDGVVVRRLE